VFLFSPRAAQADEFGRLGEVGGMVLAGGFIAGSALMLINGATLAEGGSVPGEFRDISWGFALLNIASSIGGFIGASFTDPLSTAALIYAGSGVFAAVGLLGAIFAGSVRTWSLSASTTGLRSIPTSVRW